MATLQDFLDRLAQLDADFHYFHDQQHPATQAQVDAYEQETGIRFPNEFVQFLTHTGNAVLEISPDVWPRDETDAADLAANAGYGFCIFGLNSNPETPDWINYRENFDDELNGQAFFERAGGLYNAYLRADGQIFTAYNPYDTWDDMERYEGNLFDYLIDEIEILEESYHDHIGSRADS